MKSTKPRHVFLNKFVVSGGILVIVTALTVGGLTFWHSKADAAQPTKNTPVVSDFAFTGAPDWTKGPSNATSMALFHSGTDGCFVSAEYKTGTVDVASALQKDAVAPDGYTSVSLPTQTVTIKTDEGTKSYQLYAYDETSTSGVSGQLMQGLELGYLQLTGGYIKFDGHCNTADELGSTPAAFEAYVFAKH